MVHTHTTLRTTAFTRKAGTAKASTRAASGRRSTAIIWTRVYRSGVASTVLTVRTLAGKAGHGVSSDPTVHGHDGIAGVWLSSSQQPHAPCSLRQHVHTSAIGIGVAHGISAGSNPRGPVTIAAMSSTEMSQRENLMNLDPALSRAVSFRFTVEISLSPPSGGHVRVLRGLSDAARAQSPRPYCSICLAWA